MRAKVRTFRQYLTAAENPHRAFLGSSNHLDDYFLKETMVLFALIVHDELREAISRVVSIVAADSRAKQFLQFGAGRRLSLLWHAYRGVLNVVYEKRVEPLSTEESRELTRDLHVIYTNITGTLDNLCWALLHEFAPDKSELPPQQIALFGKTIAQDGRFATLWDSIRLYEGWNKDLKERRDPATHRIPLFVPPQIVTGPQAEIYQTLMQEYWGRLVELDFDGSDAVMSRLQKLGEFTPIFLHDPAHGAFPIYPTTSDDIGHLIAVFDEVEKFFKGEASDGAADTS